jgi:hypothetical protein
MENNETESTMTKEEVFSNQELRSDVPEGSNSVIIKEHYKFSGHRTGSTVGEVFLRSSPEDTKLLIENCQFNTLKKLVVPLKINDYSGKYQEVIEELRDRSSMRNLRSNCFFEEHSYTKNLNSQNGYYIYSVQSVKDSEEEKGRSFPHVKFDNERQQMIFQYSHKKTPLRMVVDVPEEFRKYDDHPEMIMDKLVLNPPQYLLKGFEDGILTSKITEEPDHTILLIESSDEEDRFDWLENVLDEINSTIPSKKFHLEYD